MVNLRNKIKGTKNLSNKEIKEFVITLGNIIRNVSGSPAVFRTLAEATFKEWYSVANPGEKVPSIPADGSLALLLQIYEEHNGPFTNISKHFMEDYNDNGYKMFHALPQDLQDLIVA
jgi:hypothetical protein